MKKITSVTLAIVLLLGLFVAMPDVNFTVEASGTSMNMWAPYSTQFKIGDPIDI